MSEEFNPDRPFGKKATVVTLDNIEASEEALRARRRVETNRAQPGDRELLKGRETFIKMAQAKFNS